MLQHGNQHRWYADHRVGAVGFDQFEDQTGLKCFHDYLRRHLAHGAKYAQHAAAGVEQGHRRDPNVTVFDAEPIHCVGTVVDQSTVV